MIRYIDTHPQQKIHFYIDAISGQIFSHKDMEAYFKRISVPILLFILSPYHINGLFKFN